MAWVTILPRTVGGIAASSAPAVSLARRRERGAPRLHIAFNGVILTTLGWSRGEKVTIQHDPDLGLIRISRGGANCLTNQKGKSHRGSSCSAIFPNTGAGPHLAELVPHVIKDGAVIITLPAWAAPQRAGFAAAQAARDAAMARVSPTVLQMGVRPLPREPYVGSQGKRA